MSCENKYVNLIDKYIDNEIDENEKKELMEHLSTCSDCHERYIELKKAIAFIQSASHISAPSNFTESVMSQLPRKKKVVTWKKWMQRHPFLVAASIFFLMMSFSVNSIWSHSDELMVTGAANLKIDKERGAVIVPEGEVVEGDLVVRNGTLEVEGEVRGNVLLINSEQYLASAGTVSGEIEEVNQVLDWIWYHIKHFFIEVVSVFNEKE
ncbi:anti-sigma factor [Alkalihalobacillus sp. LMS39]|uniref:anti-sigma factor family protein n=1 Tax=Alkalihalobacillus sp. LMS39 TaxID=2924032 RepID=UPI001FB29CA4|nr:anti-sigma factor [Alkalihalobacillus sp. LMS39]UOE94297.1 anti-sigma factor [Alkalihalobacillus sp. LMS39]